MSAAQKKQAHEIQGRRNEKWIAENKRKDRKTLKKRCDSLHQVCTQMYPDYNKGVRGYGAEIILIDEVDIITCYSKPTFVKNLYDCTIQTQI